MTPDVDTPSRQPAWLQRLLGRWQVRSAVLMAPAHAPGDAEAIDAGVQALSQWAQAHPGASLELGLSSRWLLCAATPDATTAEQALQLAVQQWVHYLGLDEAGLQADWVLQPVVSPRVRLVCAVPRALLDGLHEAAAEQGVRLRAVLPWWAFGLQAVLGDAAEVADAAPPGPLSWCWDEPGWRTCVQAVNTANTVQAADALTSASVASAPASARGWVIDRIWMSAPDEAAGPIESVMSLTPVASLPAAPEHVGGQAAAASWLLEGDAVAGLLNRRPA